jgi:hypothetical protein
MIKPTCLVDVFTPENLHDWPNGKYLDLVGIHMNRKEGVQKIWFNSDRPNASDIQIEAEQ